MSHVEAALGVAAWSINSVDRMLIERIIKTAIVVYARCRRSR
jgi:hypothetical protein